jgi:hypothetical protein
MLLLQRKPAAARAAGTNQLLQSSSATNTTLPGLARLRLTPFHKLHSTASPAVVASAHCTTLHGSAIGLMNKQQRACCAGASMDRGGSPAYLELGPHFMRSNVKYAWSTPHSGLQSGWPRTPDALNQLNHLVGLTPRKPGGRRFANASSLYADYSPSSRALLRRTTSAPAQVRLLQSCHPPHPCRACKQNCTPSRRACLATL